MDKYVVCAYRPWNIKLFEEKISKLHYEFILMSDKKDLTVEALEKINPKIVFFLDWSWVIKEDILTKFRCVNFHTADLPKFRGGSPIQNQIARGVKNSKLSAFVMDKGIDTGDLLLKEDLSLRGHLSEIFERICETSYNMIVRIIKEDPEPKRQVGESSYYPRRKKKNSELYEEDFNKPLEYLNDFMRMLEDPYPNAFIKLGNKKILFKSSEERDGKIYAEIEMEDQGV